MRPYGLHAAGWAAAAVTVAGGLLTLLVKPPGDARAAGGNRHEP